MKRVNRTVLAARGLVVGDFGNILKNDLVRGHSEEWRRATPLQKRMVSEMWDLQATRAGWGSLGDGWSVLTRLGAAGPGGYGLARSTDDKRDGDTACAVPKQKGDMCPLVPELVALPPAGS